MQFPFEQELPADDLPKAVEETFEDVPEAPLEDDLEQEPQQEAPPQYHEQDEQPKTTRSGRVIKRTARLQESPLLPTLVSFVAKATHFAMAMAEADMNKVTELSHLFSYPASIADNDTMCLRKALQQEDRNKFLKAMVKEIEDHTARGHWRVTN